MAIEKQATGITFQTMMFSTGAAIGQKRRPPLPLSVARRKGHHTADLLQQFPDWRLSSGHAHPDANSFIIFARGEYLTGDTGYAGLPMTEHHNTLLVNGKGQAKEGDGHDVFEAVSYELLNRIRINEVKVEQNRVIVRGDATAAYEPELGLKKFVREFVYRSAAGFTVSDEVETTKPAVLTFLLHADNRIERETGSRFSIKAGGVKLLIDPAIEESNQHASKKSRAWSNRTR